MAPILEHPDFDPVPGLLRRDLAAEEGRQVRPADAEHDRPRIRVDAERRAVVAAPGRHGQPLGRSDAKTAAVFEHRVHQRVLDLGAEIGRAHV